MSFPSLTSLAEWCAELNAHVVGLASRMEMLEKQIEEIKGTPTVGRLQEMPTGEFLKERR